MPGPTPIQQYGYRILHNLMRNNLSRISELQHDLAISSPQPGWWTISVRTFAVPDRLVSICLMGDGAMIVTAQGKMTKKGAKLTTRELDYEVLFRELPKVLREQAGLIYPARDQMPDAAKL